MQSNLIELFQYSFLLFSLTSHKLAYIILINYQAEKRGYSYLFINMLKVTGEELPRLIISNAIFFSRAQKLATREVLPVPPLPLITVISFI